MQQNEHVPSVLEYLSFEADQTTQEMTAPTTPHRYGSSSSIGPNGGSRSMHMQGILWKRRDVFRNRWRPRWFVLHSDQRVLTYYLLANQESERVVSTSTTSTPSRRRPATAFATPSSSSISIGSVPNSSLHNNDNQQHKNRRRTFSESSSVSAHTIDCDVVPRGTIYLLGSTVEANEALTRPQEDLYTLTITDHENSTHCHLATRTIESRDQWIHRIRHVCQRENGVQSQQQQEQSTLDSNRTPFSPQVHISDRVGNTKATRKRNGIVANENDRDNNHRSGSQQNDRRNNTNSIAGKGLRSENKDHVREKEILILFAPLILYKVLTMMSLFGTAALCFVVTSTMVLRWVLVQHIFRFVRPFADENQNNTSSSQSMMPIGHGSVCCRLTEDLTYFFAAGSEESLSRVLIWSLAKGICQQPRLVSKKYSLLPRFYSTDVEYLKLNEESADEFDWVHVSKADEKNLNEISNCFTKTKQQHHSPVGFLRQAIGPACRIVMTSDANYDNGKDSHQVHPELTLTGCPITVFVSCVSNENQIASISINFQSTNVKACRKFVEDFQNSIQSAKI